MDLERIKKLLRPLAALALWLALLALLVRAEAGSPDSGIRTLWDAFWYFLVTVSTVGYGDLYPMTPAGKLIGAVFVLLSVGLLAFLVSFALSVIRGQMLPTLKLQTRKNRPWYIFPVWSREAQAFAVNLTAEDRSAQLIVPDSADDVPGDIPGVLAIDAPIRRILEMKKDRNCRVILMGPDSYRNYAEGRKLAETGTDVCCQTFYDPEELPANMVLFHAADCCARRYWQSYPVSGTEKEFVLIGSGRCAEELLSRALLTNVFGPLKDMHYHIFGDFTDFRRNHRMLAAVIEICTGDCPPEGEDVARDGDRIIFHEESWNEDGELIRNADRVILCDDDMGANLDILSRIHTSFPTRAQVDCRADTPYPGVRTFGTDEELYTPEYVIRQELNKRAAAMHEIYRSGADYPVPAWEELSAFMRQSNIAAADHLQTKISLLLAEQSPVTHVTADLCREAGKVWRSTYEERGVLYEEIEHDRWMRFYAMYNWDYGGDRDNRMRLHPDFQPFDGLTTEEKQKDDYAWTLLEKLGSSGAVL